MSDKNKFSLDDLNELSKGLGDSILCLLDGHQDWWSFQRAEKEINELLMVNELMSDDVLINKGLAKGLTIKVAFENAGSNYQFQDQFDA